MAEFTSTCVQRPNSRTLLGQSHQSFPPCYSKSSLQTDLVFNVNIVYRNLKSENSQYYAQKPLRNCMFMNSASVRVSEVLYIARCTLHCTISHGHCTDVAMCMGCKCRLSVLWTWYLCWWRVYYFWNISAENEKADTLAITGTSFSAGQADVCYAPCSFYSCTLSSLISIKAF